MPFFNVSSTGNDLSVKSAGCGANGSKPFGGKNAPGGGRRPPGGRLVIAGGNGNKSAPGNGTGGEVIGAVLPVGKEKRFVNGFALKYNVCGKSYRCLIWQHDVI